MSFRPPTRLFLDGRAPDHPVAIRRVFEEEGELSALIELRRHFPGITDNAKARECVRTIARWTPLPVLPATVTRLRPGRS